MCCGILKEAGEKLVMVEGQKLLRKVAVGAD